MDCTVSAPGQQAILGQGSMSKADVTVVGTGPAGALLAYLLARRGFHVIVVEKASLPRVKPCGGGLNDKTVQLLPFDLSPVRECTVSRIVFTQRLRWPFLRTYPEPLVTLITRCHFDYFLVQQAIAAGAHLYENCQVRHIDTQSRGFTLRTATGAWHSRYLAFADGARGTLRRQVGFPAAIPHDLGLDMEVVAGQECLWQPGTIYIDWGTHPQCYAWAFPKAGHWSIGVKGPAPRSTLLVHYLKQFMQRWGLRPAMDKLPFLAHTLPTRTAEMPLVQGRALVLGDAAGLLEPFTGEGIYYAIRSAHLAAEALATACLHDTLPQEYATTIETVIMPELAGARALQRLFDAYPQVFHLMVQYHPRSWRALARIIRGERGFADVGRILQRYSALVRLALYRHKAAWMCIS